MQNCLPGSYCLLIMITTLKDPSQSVLFYFTLCFALKEKRQKFGSFKVSLF